MKKQNYANHVRYYVPHHFILYPILFLLLIFNIIQITKHSGEDEWKMFAAVVLAIIWLSYMLRQHYALTLQNRIVRLEMRVRYFQLTGQRFETLEQQLTPRQIAALRFASDDELPQLLQKTVIENLSPNAIKKSVKNWLPDHMRV
jgi:hypothetical protein